MVKGRMCSSVSSICFPSRFSTQVVYHDACLVANNANIACARNTARRQCLGLLRKLGNDLTYTNYWLSVIFRAKLWYREKVFTPIRSGRGSPNGAIGDNISLHGRWPRTKTRDGVPFFSFCIKWLTHSYSIREEVARA